MCGTLLESLAFVSLEVKGCRMSKSSGFTLIEAVIVLALIGIVSAISAIFLNQWLPGYRLKAAACDLFNNMHYAKSQAVTENREWAVVFSAGAPQRYVVVSSGPDGVISTPGDNIESRSVVLSSYGSGVAFGHQPGATKVDSAAAITDNVDYVDDELIFAPNGTAGATGYVYITGNKPKTYAVGTFASGLVRLKQWDGSAWQ